MCNYATISCVCKKVSEKKLFPGTWFPVWFSFLNLHEIHRLESAKTLVKNIHAQFGMMTNTKMLANHTFLTPPNQLLS